MCAMLHSLLVFALCRSTAAIGKISAVPVASVLTEAPAVMAPQTALTAVTKLTVVGVPSQITDALDISMGGACVIVHGVMMCLSVHV